MKGEIMEKQIKTDTKRAIARFKEIDNIVEGLFPSIVTKRAERTLDEAFALGRESVNMNCEYNHNQNSFNLATYFKATGHCLGCEAVLTEEDMNYEKYSNEGAPEYEGDR